MSLLIIVTALFNVLFGSPSMADVAKQSNEPSLPVGDVKVETAKKSATLILCMLMVTFYVFVPATLNRLHRVSFYHHIFGFSDKFLDALTILKLVLINENI